MQDRHQSPVPEWPALEPPRGVGCHGPRSSVCVTRNGRWSKTARDTFGRCFAELPEFQHLRGRRDLRNSCVFRASLHWWARPERSLPLAPDVVHVRASTIHCSGPCLNRLDGHSRCRVSCPSTTNSLAGRVGRTAAAGARAFSRRNDWQASDDHQVVAALPGSLGTHLFQCLASKLGCSLVPARRRSPIVISSYIDPPRLPVQTG